MELDLPLTQINLIAMLQENDAVFGWSNYQKNHTGNQYSFMIDEKGYDVTNCDDKMAITW